MHDSENPTIRNRAHTALVQHCNDTKRQISNMKHGDNNDDNVAENHKVSYDYWHRGAAMAHVNQSDMYEQQSCTHTHTHMHLYRCGVTLVIRGTIKHTSKQGYRFSRSLAMRRKTVCSFVMANMQSTNYTERWGSFSLSLSRKKKFFCDFNLKWH